MSAIILNAGPFRGPAIEQGGKVQTTITYLKSGKFAMHPARGPVVMCKKGKTEQVPEEWAKMLEDAGWADIEEAPEEEVPEEDDGKGKGESDPVVPPWKQENWDPETDNAKDMLEAYGLGVFEINIDKRKSVSKIIEQLEELGELTGDN